MKNLNIFYFDNDLGNFDEFNPRFVMEQKFANDILSLIAIKQPFYYDITNLATKLKTNITILEKPINLLKNISAITEKSGYFCLNFPFFLDKDVKIIKTIVLILLKNHHTALIDSIQSLRKQLIELYPTIKIELSLYHLLCGKIFDGLMFDYLEQQGLLKQSYIQNDNRDFMLVGYQNSNMCNKFNANLYCSFNNAKYKDNSLTSFGNASGKRLDYFRYFKLREKNNLYGKFLIMHRYFQNKTNSEIVKNSLDNIIDLLNKKQVINNKYLEILKLTNYVDKDNQIIVPVFDNYILKTNILFEEVKRKLGSNLTKILNDFKTLILDSNINCIKHNVPMEQLCNELWHIFFGLFNEYLIKEKVVASPQQFFKQGKYLKCIYLSKQRI